MSSFAWSSRFREGQWRAFRRFMLEERRDATARFLVIDAERERIGDVRILYEIDESGEPTERRIGISVTPDDSTLAKLLAAYTSLGGNPLDISMFSAPDRSVFISGEGTKSMDPGGGLLHQENIVYAYDQGVMDGDTNLVKYRSSRRGGKRLADKEPEILSIVNRGRKWIQKEINFKRTRLEELIVKMVDLREQLDEEVSDLLWATYGDMMGGVYDSDRFNDSLTVANIAYFFDSTFRTPDPSDPGRVPVNNEAGPGEPGSINYPVLSGFDSLMLDDDDESNTSF